MDNLSVPCGFGGRFLSIEDCRNWVFPIHCFGFAAWERDTVLRIFTVIFQGVSCLVSSLNLKFCHFNILWFCPPLQFQNDLYSQPNANSAWTFYIIFSMKILKCSLNKVIPPLLGREIVFQFRRWGNKVHNLLGTPYGAYRENRWPGLFYSWQPGRCLRSLFYEYHVAL